MASLITGKGHVVLTSGLKFWPIPISSSPSWSIPVRCLRRPRRQPNTSDSTEFNIPIREGAWRDNLWDMRTQLEAEAETLAKATTPVPPVASVATTADPQTPRKYGKTMRLEPYIKVEAGQGDLMKEIKERAAQNVLIPWSQKAEIQPYRNFCRDLKVRAQDTPLTVANQREVLKSSLTPLHDLPYAEELRLKSQFTAELVLRYLRGLGPAYLDRKQSQHIFETVASPVLEGYRNRNEFMVNVSVDGVEKTVGCVLKSAQGLRSVPPDGVLSLKEAHLRMAHLYQDFIRQSPLEAHELPSAETPDPVGHWREIMVRSNQADQILVMVGFHPQQLSSEAVEEQKQALVDYTSVRASDYNLDIQGIYFQIKGTESSPEVISELIHGESHVEEEINGIKFLIRPTSKFPINLSSSLNHLNLVRDMLGPSKDMTVIEIGCGSGFFSLNLAKRVKFWYGFDVSHDCIEDAEESADLNGIKNCSFESGKPVGLLQDILEEVHYQTGPLAVILDSERRGVHAKIIETIRKCGKIRKVIFLTSNGNDPNTKMNLYHLSKNTPKKQKSKIKSNPLGKPFHLKNVIGVDSLPRTVHFDHIFKFIR